MVINNKYEINAKTGKINKSEVEFEEIIIEDIDEIDKRLKQYNLIDDSKIQARKDLK